jgi:hypothetical protein
VVVLEEHERRIKRGEILILPATAVIEAGNFIAQLRDGNVRRTTAQRFEAIIEAVIQGKAPWTLHAYTWDAEFLKRLVVKDSSNRLTDSRLVRLAQQKIGCGDLWILVERDVYRERSGIGTVGIWTLDQSLCSLA